MAYCDYGAFVYRNGERRTDKEDAPIFGQDEGPFEIDTNVPNGCRYNILSSFFKGYQNGNHPSLSNSYHHGVLGDGPIRVVCYKQGLPRIYEVINNDNGDAREILFYNEDEINPFEFYDFSFKYKGYKFFFEYDHPYVVEMIEPDGTCWRCEYDYQYGAGFEEEE